MVSNYTNFPALKSSLEECFSLENFITKTLQSKKAIDIVSINMDGKSDLSDEIIIATGTSSVHRKTLCDYVERAFLQMGVEVFGIEGRENTDWIIIDTAEIIVHIFSPESRALYSLEKMWSGDFGDEDENLDTREIFI